MLDFPVYCIRLAVLWAVGDIDWLTVRYALAERPAVVCGRGGAFVLDDNVK